MDRLSDSDETVEVKTEFTNYCHQQFEDDAKKAVEAILQDRGLDQCGRAIPLSAEPVSGVTYASGFPELIIGGQRIPVGQVMEVIEPGSDEPQAETPEDPETIEARFAPIDAAPYRP